LEPETAGAEVQSTSGTTPREFPVIEGLVTSEGLANANDDPKNYLKVLRQFAEEHANAPDKIRDALLQGDLAAAQQVVQALKIAANKIGATAVHKAATALARACHERSDPSEIESVWSELEKELRELVATLKPVVQPQEDEPALSRRLPAAPPVDPAQLRKAVSQILPLLAERDPGAKDCLRDNRKTFRSAFTPETYVEFEQLVKNGDFDAALEQLKKAARKHGISL
jgi:HPt (histidine-containing phosphotransfer) domain-containing protein